MTTVHQDRLYQIILKELLVFGSARFPQNNPHMDLPTFEFRLSCTRRRRFNSDTNLLQFITFRISPFLISITSRRPNCSPPSKKVNLPGSLNWIVLGRSAERDEFPVIIVRVQDEVQREILYSLLTVPSRIPRSIFEPRSRL